jgi:peptidoglycan/LPS O-acetylase OafA/YrhL
MVTAATYDVTERPGAKARRFPCLDGLRALAAFAVVFHHVGFETGATFHSRFGDFIARGDAGVPVFFALSGFLLYRPFVAHHAGKGGAVRVGRFWWNRFLRIYPAYWVALTVTLLWLDQPPRSTGDLLAMYSLQHVYRARLAFAGLAQAWTLSVEVTFYAVLPLLAWCAARLAARVGADRWRNAELGFVAALFAASILWRIGLYAFDVTWTGTAIFWLPSNLDLFAVGMAFAILSVHVGELRGSSAFASWCGRHAGVCWAVAGLMFVLISKVVTLPKGIEVTPGPQSVASRLIYAVMAGALLAPLVFGDQGKGLVRRVLRLRPVVFCGVVSYGIYLWHKTFIDKAVQWTNGSLFHAHTWEVLAITVACTLVVSWLSHRLLEEPLQRKFGRSWRQPLPDRSGASR